MKRNTYLSIGLGWLLSSCTSQTVEFEIVGTSDVHGCFYPYNFTDDKPAKGSLASVCSYLKEQRRHYGDRLLYVDNGDILQGQPCVYYYNTVRIDQPHLAAEVLNYLQCDAATMGNHDIETGGPTYQRYMNDARYPIMGANIEFDGSDHCFLYPYTVIERKGVKVAFLGLITPAIPNWLPQNLWRELAFRDMEATARRWMDTLRVKENPDVVVGLFHSGRMGGIVTDAYKENASVEIARRVPGFDAIFFGHDHQEYNDTVINCEGKPVYLLNPGSGAHQVMALKVSVQKPTRKNTSLQPCTKVFSSELVSVDSIEPDAAYLRTFAPQKEEVKKYVSEKVGTFTQTLSTRDAYFGPSTFVDFIHQAQLDIMRAQISFVAPLSFDATIKKGDVYVRDLFNLCRYENMLYLMRMTGKEIKDYLEMSYASWVNQMRSKDDHLLAFDELKEGKRPRLKGNFNSFDSAAGIRYEVDVTRPAGQRVHILCMADGKPFDMEKWYYVAMNSYRGNGGGELLTKGAGIPKEELSKRLEVSTDVDLRFYLLHYIQERDTVEPRTLDQWKFVPEAWTVPAAQRDRALLFPAH